MPRKKKAKPHTDSNETVKNDTDYTLLSDSELWALLTPLQRRYVVASTENPDMNIKQLAEYIGASPRTAYEWDGRVNEAVDRALKRAHDSAIAMRQSALVKAMAVKLALLDNEDVAIRNRVATEIIEWELGRSTDRKEIKATVTNEWADIMRISDDDDSDDDFA